VSSLICEVFAMFSAVGPSRIWWQDNTKIQNNNNCCKTVASESVVDLQYWL